MTTEMTAAAASALALVPGQTDWTDAQQAAFAAIGLSKAPDADRKAFLHLCLATGLDPWRREVYLIPREVWNARLGENEVRWTAQTGIDGYRHLAESTGKYAGRVGPQWCGPDGVWKDVWISDEAPVAARVGILRDGFPEPVWAVAHFREYVPLTDEKVQGRRTGKKVPTSMWRKMPAGQIAKCAEALAFRAAFPRRFAGLYVDEEMHQADQLAKDAAEAARAQLAREARATVARGDAPPPEPAPDAAADDGEVVGAVLTRDDLLAEFAEQARAMGKTPEQLLKRWSARHGGKPIEDATDEELHELVVANRDYVREATRGDMPATAEQRAAARAQAAAPDRAALLAELDAQAQALGKTTAQHVSRLLARHRCPLEQIPDDAIGEYVAAHRTAQPEPTTVMVGPHAFEYNADGDNDLCVQPGCEQPVDADIHMPQPGPGQDALL